MTPCPDARIAQALLQMERTRTQLVLKCAGSCTEPGAETGLSPADNELINLLDAVLTEGVADDWIARHPWVSVATGLLVGGLAASQRKRLIGWAAAHALPWLTSQGAMLLVPLLAQWLSSQPAPAGATPDATDPDLSEPNSPAAGSPA